MRLIIRGFSAAVAAAVLGAGAAQASHGKVGLWEITVNLHRQGMPQMPDLSKLPPDVRARMKGMRMNGNTITTHHCMTAKEVATDVPPVGQRRNDCKLVKSHASGHKYSGEMVCSGRFKGTGHMDVVYDSDTHYTGEMTMKGTAEGHPMDMHETFEGQMGIADLQKRDALSAPDGMNEPDGMDEDGASAFARFLHAARRAVVFTGAGISTESGIPDFRSPGGLWTKYAPIVFQDFISDAELRREAWRRRFAMDETFGKVKPNAGHMAVCDLVARGIVSHVVTQNVDNLHQDSGVPEDKVIEIHGNTHYARCIACGTRTELVPIRAHFEAHGDPPDCAACGGLLKTATISFGQAMPEQEMARAEAAALACDLFIVLGSSLVVYPAAGLPLLARRNRARLVIVNRDPTDMDEVADLVIHSGIGSDCGPFHAIADSRPGLNHLAAWARKPANDRITIWQGPATGEWTNLPAPLKEGPEEWKDSV